MSELKQMREVNPTDLVNEELAKRRMYEQNYMRLYSRAPSEHLPEEEICNMIRLRPPEPIQNGLAGQLALTPMNAISAAETLRKACQASQRSAKSASTPEARHHPPREETWGSRRVT